MLSELVALYFNKEHKKTPSKEGVFKNTNTIIIEQIEGQLQ